jgi:homocysteine S-methyltransferase
VQILILDGALGTELARRGWDVSDCLWSARVVLDNPEAIEQIPFDYLEAGARCITTGSYQISFEGFEKAGIAREDTANALTMSVDTAQRARSRFLNIYPGQKTPPVAASVGPYGASLADGSEFHGNYRASFAELLAFHANACFASEKPIQVFLHAKRSLPCKKQKSFCKRSCSFQAFQCGFRLPAAMLCTPFMEN